MGNFDADNIQFLPVKLRVADDFAVQLIDVPFVCRFGETLSVFVIRRGGGGFGEAARFQTHFVERFLRKSERLHKILIPVLSHRNLRNIEFFPLINQLGGGKFVPESALFRKFFRGCVLAVIRRDDGKRRRGMNHFFRGTGGGIAVSLVSVLREDIDVIKSLVVVFDVGEPYDFFLIFLCRFQPDGKNFLTVFFHLFD